MTDSDSLSSFLARPGQSLEDHLRGVDAAGQELINGAGTNPYGDDWEAVIETLSWTHDIGKLTEYFQEYIRTGHRDGVHPIELTYHGTFGAFISVLALYQRDCSDRTVAAGFYAVAKHHSVLQNIQSDFKNYSEETSEVDARYEICVSQLENIEATATTAADVVAANATDGASWQDLIAMLQGNGLGTIRKTIDTLGELTDDEEFYGCALRTWSTLVAADKFNASGLTNVDNANHVSDINPPEVDCLTSAVRDVSDTPLPTGEDTSVFLDDPNRPLPDADATVTQRLDAIRTAANRQAAENLLDASSEGKRVFELTLPTGFGKTYTGLRAALELAQKRDSRVIYALPYTSIIDQVDEEIREVFGLDPADPVYTKHHHLADTRSRLEESTGFRDDASSGQETLHAESWQSGLVLTTFTQLFESVAGPGNVQSTKLPSLQDSVIVVDEPQAVPHDWWGLVGRLTEFLSTEYDATLLFMTATQPRLLQELSGVPTPRPLVDFREEATQLIADTPRVIFELHDSLSGHLNGDGTPPLSLDAAASEITKQRGNNRNSLAVVNTVGSAVSLTEHLSGPECVNLASELVPYLREQEGNSIDSDAYLRRLSAANPDADTLLAALTTRIRPIDRRALLSCLDRILDSEANTPFDDKPTVTVSTQLIEAGVDLSFDRLYRDYAPLPSFVQVAGRCNRRFGGDPSSVTMWRLDSPIEDSYVPSHLIYASLLRPTRKALQTLQEDVGSQILPESEMITSGVETYYESLHTQLRTDDRIDVLVEAFNSAKGKQLRNASLIHSDYPTQEFTVLVTETETSQYETYQRQKDQKQWKAARKTFQSLKQTLVSVPLEGPPRGEPVMIDATDDPAVYELATGRGIVEQTARSDTEV